MRWPNHRVILALLAVILAAGCAEPTPARLALWRDVTKAQEAATENPDSLAARQAWIDALANYVVAYPGDADASATYEREQLAYARALTRHGRYGTAIAHYESILVRNPSNDEARRELEGARGRDAIPRTRFDGLRKGMSQDEVIAILGEHRPGWTHRLEKGGRIHETWYYRRGDGGLASVTFVDGAATLAEYGEVISLGR